MTDRNSAKQTVGATETTVAGAARRRMPRLMGLGLGVALGLVMAGCHKTPAQSAAIAQVDQDPGDPADANMAPVSGNVQSQPAQVLGQNVQYQPQQQGEDYSQQPPAPIERRNPSVSPNDGDQSYQNAPDDSGAYDSGAYDDQQAQDAYASDLTEAESDQPPPPLPDYEQPPAPDPDYLWTPGYWAWGYGGYYWVPGAWVAAPYTGALWTPGYWGYVGNRYRFHHGFWGLHIGFYGGVDYGYGYTGYGYYGGYWDHDHFRYNTAVNRVNTSVIRNVYTHNVVINGRTSNGPPVNRVSFNGGRGGIQARPRPAELQVLHGQRNAPTASQVQVQREAGQNRSQFYNQNKGRPAVVVNARPVAADRTMPAALPRVAVPVRRPGFTGGTRPGAPQQVQPQQQGRPNVTQPDVRQTQQANRPGQVQPEGRPGQPGGQQRDSQRNVVPPQAQPAPPQPQVRQPQSQLRPALPGVQRDQPGFRQGQPNVQERPAPQAPQRPQYQQRNQAQPAPPVESRPQVQSRPAEQPRPQEQARPQEQMRPQQQARPQEQARPPQTAAPARPAPPAHDAAAPHEQPDSHAGSAPRPQGDSHTDDRPHR